MVWKFNAMIIKHKPTITNYCPFLVLLLISASNNNNNNNGLLQQYCFIRRLRDTSIKLHTHRMAKRWRDGEKEKRKSNYRRKDLILTKNAWLLRNGVGSRSSLCAFPCFSTITYILRCLSRSQNQIRYEQFFFSEHTCSSLAQNNSIHIKINVVGPVWFFVFSPFECLCERESHEQMCKIYVFMFKDIHCNCVIWLDETQLIRIRRELQCMLCLFVLNTSMSRTARVSTHNCELACNFMHLHKDTSTRWSKRGRKRRKWQQKNSEYSTSRKWTVQAVKCKNVFMQKRRTRASMVARVGWKAKEFCESGPM